MAQINQPTNMKDIKHLKPSDLDNHIVLVSLGLSRFEVATTDNLNFFNFFNNKMYFSKPNNIFIEIESFKLIDKF